MGWQAERIILEQKIASLKTGMIGPSLTVSQRKDAIKAHIEVMGHFDDLITEFSRCDSFPIIVKPVEPDRKPIVRIRFGQHRQADSMFADA